jgi:hypothetical protein
MRCVMCNRPLIRQAAPGLMIGPVCAAKRGLLPVIAKTRPSPVIPVTRKRKKDLETPDLFEVSHG